MTDINTRLYKMRKHLGKTQKNFGEVGGVSQSTQNRYEHSGTDVPMSYLKKIFETFGSGFNEAWFYFGKGPMRQDLPENFKYKPGFVPNSHFTGLSQKESQIIAEVGQFSEFLKNRPLRPEVKRHLLQLLIESIDQALEELQDTDHPEN